MEKCECILLHCARGCLIVSSSSSSTFSSSSSTYSPSSSSSSSTYSPSSYMYTMFSSVKYIFLSTVVFMKHFKQKTNNVSDMIKILSKLKPQKCFSVKSLPPHESSRSLDTCFPICDLSAILYLHLWLHCIWGQKSEC